MPNDSTTPETGDKAGTRAQAQTTLHDVESALAIICEVEREFATPSLLGRISTQIVRLGSRLDPRTLTQWARAVAEDNVKSPPAVGCLLAMVRQAWGDSSVYAQDRGPDGWWVWESSPAAGTLARGQPTEAEALVAALEAS